MNAVHGCMPPALPTGPVATSSAAVDADVSPITPPVVNQELEGTVDVNMEAPTHTPTVAPTLAPIFRGITAAPKPSARPSAAASRLGEGAGILPIQEPPFPLPPSAWGGGGRLIMQAD